MDPKTVIFFCNWSAYPGLQMSENPLEKSELSSKLVVSMCSGRISPEIIFGWIFALWQFQVSIDTFNSKAVLCFKIDVVK